MPAPEYCLDARGESLATQGCRYPADSSDLTTGAAGAATSTPASLRHWSVRGLGLTLDPVPAGDQGSTFHATHSPLAGQRDRCRRPRAIEKNARTRKADQECLQLHDIRLQALEIMNGNSRFK